MAGYLVATLILGAALAPWLYELAQGGCRLIQTFKWTEMPGLSWLYAHVVKADFTRVFNRAMLCSGLICLWPTFRLLRAPVADARPLRERLGLQRNPWWAAHAGVGFILGAGLLLAMGWALVGAGAFTWRSNPQLAQGLGLAVQKGLGAGLAEECFFRALLLGLLLRAASPRVALLFVTTVFAAVHFLQAPEALVFGAPHVHAGTGFWLVKVILGGFLDTRFLLAEFCTLWMAGFILACARLRTHSLWLSIGLHSGWVFGITLYGFLTKGTKPLRHGAWMPWMGDDLKTGLIPCGVLALTGGLLWWLGRRSLSESDSTRTAQP
jgi:uncharacterized protein